MHPRRHVIQHDGTWAEKPPVPETRPLWTVAGTDIRAHTRRMAVERYAHRNHRDTTPSYPYTVTVQRKSGGPTVSMEVSTRPQEPVFRLTVL